MNDRYLIIEGLDGIGKGVALTAITHYAQSIGLRVFDLHEHWKTNNRSPTPSTYDDYDVIITGEPRYAGTGADVRWWLENKDRYLSAADMAELYSVDRKQHLEQIVHPALDRGKLVVQSRTWLSTCVYQPMMAREQSEPELSISAIAEHPGNRLARCRPPQVLLIGTVADIGTLEERFNADHREDTDRYERLEFQSSIKPYYHDQDLLSFFSEANTIFYDASVSIEHSQRSSVAAFKLLLDRP